MTEPNYFNLLPPEVWAHVLSFNNLNEVVNFGWTCKSAMVLTDYTRKHLAPKRLCKMLYHRDWSDLTKTLKTIDRLKKVLQRHYIHSIGEYEELLFYLTCRGVLAGGAAAYERCLFMDPKAVGDIDIFILNNNVEVLKECIHKLTKWLGLNEIKISGGRSVVCCGIFQVILTQHQTVSELLDNFDLDCVACGYYQGTWFVSEDCWKAHCTRRVTKHLPTLVSRYLKAERKGFEIPVKLKINHYLRKGSISYDICLWFEFELIDDFKPLHIKGGEYSGDLRITLKDSPAELVELEKGLTHQKRNSSEEDFNYLRFRSRIKELYLAKSVQCQCYIFGEDDYSYFNGYTTERFYDTENYDKYIREIKKEENERHLAGLPILNHIVVEHSPLPHQYTFTFDYFLSYQVIRQIIRDKREVWIYAKQELFESDRQHKEIVLDRRYFCTTTEDHREFLVEAQP